MLQHMGGLGDSLYIFTSHFPCPSRPGSPTTGVGPPRCWWRRDVDEDRCERVLDVRRRDEQRLEMQIAGGLRAGLSLMRGNIATTQPAPLVVPRKKAKALNEEAAETIEGGD